MLTDLTLKPLYVNEKAVDLLTFATGRTAASAAMIQQRMRFILQMERCSIVPPPTEFLSGKRRYLCRPFMLEAVVPAARRPMVAFSLERLARKAIATSEAADRYHLSPRERETLEHLSRGLRTKEIAERMHVSPHTIKQFIRIVAGKVGASTRSGIVGKLMSG